jgi:hypothetical protein
MPLGGVMKLYPNQLQALRTLLTVWSDNPEKLVGEILDAFEHFYNSHKELQDALEETGSMLSAYQADANALDFTYAHVESVTKEIFEGINPINGIGFFHDPSKMSFQQLGVIQYLMGKKIISQEQNSNLLRVLLSWDPADPTKETKATGAWATKAIAKLESLPDRR